MDLTAALEARRNSDGGYGPTPGAASEPEATALAAMAIEDAGAAAWLEDQQRLDGSVGMAAGPVFRDLTAPALLAMRSSASLSAGLSHLTASRARAEPSTDQVPHDPSARGWSWTAGTYGWVEPTAWAVLALRSLGHVGPELEDGINVLRDRACVGGGWNYGNRIVLGEELPPFVQTTAITLLALAGIDDRVVASGLDVLRSIWRRERDGVLSLALATAALRRFRTREARAAADELAATLGRRPDVDSIALAWGTIALGDGLDRLEVA